MEFSGNTQCSAGCLESNHVIFLSLKNPAFMLAIYLQLISFFFRFSVRMSERWTGETRVWRRTFTTDHECAFYDQIFKPCFSFLDPGKPGHLLTPTQLKNVVWLAGYSKCKIVFVQLPVLWCNLCVRCVFNILCLINVKNNVINFVRYVNVSIFLSISSAIKCENVMTVKSEFVFISPSWLLDIQSCLNRISCLQNPKHDVLFCHFFFVH